MSFWGAFPAAIGLANHRSGASGRLAT